MEVRTAGQCLGAKDIRWKEVAGLVHILWMEIVEPLQDLVGSSSQSKVGRVQLTHEKKKQAKYEP